MELNQREKYFEIISRETLESISDIALKELEYLNGENLERFNLFQYKAISLFKQYLNYSGV